MTKLQCTFSYNKLKIIVHWLIVFIVIVLTVNRPYNTIKLAHVHLYIRLVCVNDWLCWLTSLHVKWVIMLFNGLRAAVRSERVLKMREKSEKCICYYETGKNACEWLLVKSMWVDSGNRHKLKCKHEWKKYEPRSIVFLPKDTRIWRLWNGNIIRSCVCVCVHPPLSLNNCKCGLTFSFPQHKSICNAVLDWLGSLGGPTHYTWHVPCI